MWFNLSDFDRDVEESRIAAFANQFGAMSELWRQLDRAGLGNAPAFGGPAARDTSAVCIDTGDGFEIRIDVPGVREEDLRLDVHDATLTLTARRDIKPREGYAVHRAERGAFEWKKSLTLPTKVDSEKTAARLTDGVLTVRLAKAAGQSPRRITIAH